VHLGRLLVTLGQDSTARVWEVATGHQITELRGDRDRWATASFNPKGTLVITGGGHNRATVWDARTRARLIELPGESLDAVTATFTPDGKRLLVAGDTARIYDCDECGPVDALIALARSRATRELTAGEREEFLHESRQ